MLGGIEIPFWAIVAMLFTWSLPLAVAGLIFLFGTKLGKYRIVVSVLVLVIGLLFIEDLVELLFS